MGAHTVSPNVTFSLIFRNKWRKEIACYEGDVMIIDQDDASLTESSSVLLLR